MNIVGKSFSAALIALMSGGASLAQTTDTIVVFDGSGSMWGQIGGKAKIEIARETLSTVLTEIPSQARIGMIAYGHRQKGVCSDIETVVPVGAANQSVPRMIDVANRLQPKGKTPLTDAVRIAAGELKYTENAATVILVTDGIETCDADPCALANELERSGVGFTAHVVGFGLSKEEGQQVQCLADNTGGLYLSANNADELGDALRQTVQVQPIEPDDSDFGPAEVDTRNVRFIFTDVEGGEQIGIRQLSGLVERADGTPLDPGAFELAYPEAKGNSAVGTLEPGDYIALLRRRDGDGDGYSVRLPFSIPQGSGEHIVEAALSGALTLNIFINPELPYVSGELFPTAVGGSRPRFNFNIFPVENGVKAEEPVVTIKGANKLTRPLPPGKYLIQGNIDSGTSAEKIIDVQAGTPTIVDFSFDATRVFVDAREADGIPVKRQTTYWYDKMRSGRNYWLSGRGAGDGGVTPFYLPTGKWKLNVGGEGYGARRSERIVTVPGDFQDIRIKVGEGEVLSQADIDMLNERGSGCLDILVVIRGGCLVERANLNNTGTQADELDIKPAPMPTPERPQNGMLDGLSGTAYAFVDQNREPKVHVVFEPGNTDTATIVLSDGWCGSSQCAADRFAIGYDEVDLLLEDGFRAKSAGANSYTLAISTFGADKEIVVSGAGASRVPFNFMDTIELGNAASAPAPQKASIADRVNQVFGVFNFDKSGAPLQTVTSDFLHVQGCQRNPVVIYPDNTIAFKQFVPPQDASENTYKTVASGTCDVSGSRFDCAVEDVQTGQQQNMRFVSAFLGNNHYTLTMDDEATPTLAAACFYPGGALKADQRMPNGRALADLMLERADGAQAGLGFDKNNNAFRGK